MGGFFGATSRKDAVADVFFGTDYHSHLGTRRGGMAAWNTEIGFQREIHNIETSPFRTKFSDILDEMHGNACIGCISDSDPQPILIRSKLGTYAMIMTGIVTNKDVLIEQYLSDLSGHFDAMTGGAVNSTELVAALINQKSDFASGIRFAQEKIEGSATILILKEGGSIIAARDLLGRLPVNIGANEDGFCVSFESFALDKLGYNFVRQLGPGEITELSPGGEKILMPALKKKRICAFLWTYYGYPNSEYEGKNVECVRNRGGEILAEADSKNCDIKSIDTVSGVPDSGTAYAIGYANKSRIPFARPFIKYTPTWPRSFMPSTKASSDKIAKMKLIPVRQLIKGKSLLFVDDSIVRGTQLRETVDFLYSNGAKDVHMRSACPPIMYGCKYLNFTRKTPDTDLIARQIITKFEGEEGEKHIEEYADGTTERGKALRREICKRFHFASLEYQTLDGIIKSIGLDPCDVCTYCWNGKE